MAAGFRPRTGVVPRCLLQLPQAPGEVGSNQSSQPFHYARRMCSLLKGPRSRERPACTNTRARLVDTAFFAPSFGNGVSRLRKVTSTTWELKPEGERTRVKHPQTQPAIHQLTKQCSNTIKYLPNNIRPVSSSTMQAKSPAHQHSHNHDETPTNSTHQKHLSPSRVTRARPGPCPRPQTTNE